MLCNCYVYAGLSRYAHTSTSLAGQTIPEAEQLLDAPVDNDALAALLNSFQNMGVTSIQPTKKSQPEQNPHGGVGQTHIASPFASPEHAVPLDIHEGEDAKAVGATRMRGQGSNQTRQLSGGAASLASSASSGPTAHASSAGRPGHSPFASPNQQLHKVASTSSTGSVPGRSPSGRISQPISRQASSPSVPSPQS